MEFLEFLELLEFSEFLEFVEFSDCLEFFGFLEFLEFLGVLELGDGVYSFECFAIVKCCCILWNLCWLKRI